MERRDAKSAMGLPVGATGEEGFYAEVGGNFASSGIKISRISVTRDGAGASGFFDRVTVWSDKADLLWEGPLSGLEGVSYV